MTLSVAELCASVYTLHIGNIYFVYAAFNIYSIFLCLIGLLQNLQRAANDVESFCWKYFMDKMQPSHKYKLEITLIVFTRISVNLLHMWD